MNLHGVSDVKQSEKHKEKPLVPELVLFEVEVAAGNLKAHKSIAIKNSRIVSSMP